MNKADVAGADKSAAAAAACHGSQMHLQGLGMETSTTERSLREDGDLAVLSASSAAGADRASGAEDFQGAKGFESTGAEGKDKVVVGYWKEHSTLTHVIIRNAGHMVCLSH